MFNFIENTILDLKKGFISPSQWLYLGYLDIKLRYQRTFLGPWWITFSTYLIIFALSFIWSRVFNLNLNEYFLYFSSGYIYWQFFSGTINESTKIFIEFKGVILQFKLPLSIYFYRLFTRNFIIFLHNFIILILINVFFFDYLHVQILGLLIGLILFGFFLFFSSAIVAIISTRFDDFEQFVPTLLQLTFFASPIIWMPDSIKSEFLLLKYNPIYHILNLVRDPLMGNHLDNYSLDFTLAFLAFLFIFYSFVFNQCRNKLVFWT